MFNDMVLDNENPIYLQIERYIKQMILQGMLQSDVKLPSTRELSTILKVSRNTVMMAYQNLEAEGYIYMIKGKGAFVSKLQIVQKDTWKIDWSRKVNLYTLLAEELDIMKHGVKWEKGMISFTSIAPDENLFDMEEFKRAFLNRVSQEGEKLLNYGYARGYLPLMQYLKKYMNDKGVNTEGKDIIITNGFTEGFDVVLSALTEKGDRIVCENPTHNTAIKIMKMHGLEIVGINMQEDGLNIKELTTRITEKSVKLAYLVPSYHNPTGIVMSPEKRIEVFNIFQQYEIPVIEDGFNEELRYSGSHVSPLIALAGSGNSVIYIGSFSKVLFPGMRIGWILGDQRLISYLESIKRSRNIHTSFIDQAVLYEYLQAGNFEKYIKKIRRIYKEKYEFALECAKKHIPCKKILGEGGMHIFIELDGINCRDLLDKCSQKGVIFTPGDRFYTDNGGKNTFRLGISRVTERDIEKGFRIIGEVIRQWETED